MKKRIVSLFTSLLMMFSLAVVVPTMNVSAAGLGLSDLKAKFPQGAYWNHVVNSYNQYGDVLMNNNDNSFADSITYAPCATHNGTPSYGQRDCNVFNKSMQCAGFAKKLAYDVYGSICTSWGTVSYSNAKPGDVIHYHRSTYPYNTPSDDGHWAMIIAKNGNTMTFGECNVDTNCYIRWDRTLNITGVDSYVIYSAPYTLPQSSTPLTTPTITTNKETYSIGENVSVSWAASSSNSSLSHYWIYAYDPNGTKIVDKRLDVNYFSFTVNQTGKYHLLVYATPKGSNDGEGSLTAEKDIMVGHNWGSWQTTIAATCTTDGLQTRKCSDCGQTETKTIPKTGHTYVNKIIKPTTTEKGYTLHTCSKCGDSYKDTYVDSPKQNSDGWYYCDALPSDVNSDKYTIQYNNYYEKIQTTSPGSDWTNAGTVKSEWQNSGSQYKSAYDLTTSDSRILVSSIYYHFCGPNAGNEANYEQSGNFVHYDWIAADRVVSTYLGDDNGHPYYFINWPGGNQIYCATDVTCDGTYGSHSARSRAWYKENTYQDRVKVESFKFTKESGWTSSMDSFANNVTCRYKLKSTSISSCTISLPTATQYFRGTRIRPVVTIKDGNKVLKSGTDYTISYTNNLSVGKATVTITGKGDYTGTVTKNFDIVQRSIGNCDVELGATNYYFNGTRIKPSVKVYCNGTEMYNGNYTVAYSNNLSAGTATITLTGKKNLKGTVTKTFKINPRNIANCTVELTKNSANKYQPTVTVKIGSTSVYNGNYTVKYVASADKKTVKVTLTGKGNLAGTVTKTYTVA